MSSYACEQKPSFLIRLFELFIQKAAPRRESPELLFSLFLWSLCKLIAVSVFLRLMLFAGFLNEEGTALTIALLFAKPGSQKLSGKALKRMYTLLYSLDGKRSALQVQQQARQCASEVAAYCKCIAEVDSSSPKRCTKEHHTDDVCDRCTIPIPVFLRFLSTRQRVRLWPATMIQEHVSCLRLSVVRLSDVLARSFDAFCLEKISGGQCATGIRNSSKIQATAWQQPRSMQVGTLQVPIHATHLRSPGSSLDCMKRFKQ
jgi:hypothetical protein